MSRCSGRPEVASGPSRYSTKRIAQHVRLRRICPAACSFPAPSKSVGTDTAERHVAPPEPPTDIDADAAAAVPAAAAAAVQSSQLSRVRLYAGTFYEYRPSERTELCLLGSDGNTRVRGRGERDRGGARVSVPTSACADRYPPRRPGLADTATNRRAACAFASQKVDPERALAAAERNLSDNGRERERRAGREPDSFHQQGAPTTVPETHVRRSV